jgi:hypothetical protein
VLIQYFEYPWRAAKPKANLQGEGFKEELQHGNEEKGCKEESREEEETLTNRRGSDLAKFLQEKLASANSFRGLFCWP